MFVVVSLNEMLFHFCAPWTLELGYSIPLHTINSIKMLRRWMWQWNAVTGLYCVTSITINSTKQEEDDFSFDNFFEHETWNLREYISRNRIFTSFLSSKSLKMPFWKLRCKDFMTNVQPNLSCQVCSLIQNSHINSKDIKFWRLCFLKKRNLGSINSPCEWQGLTQSCW